MKYTETDEAFGFESSLCDHVTRMEAFYKMFFFSFPDWKQQRGGGALEPIMQYKGEMYTHAEVA